MPDWLGEVRRKLADSKFSASERDEISRELAGYLDDLCNGSQASGADESSAVARAARELREDPYLGANLAFARKEKIMNYLTKGIWLPGLMNLVASVLCLAIFEAAGLGPHVVGHFGSVVNYSPVTISITWLCVLPFLGAGSACFSRRAGSGRALQVTAGLFPVLVFLAAIVVVVPLNFGFTGLPGLNTILPAIAAGALSMVVIPGAALLLGVLPFLLTPAKRSHEINSAISAP